jgi:hypothetical protein
VTRPSFSKSLNPSIRVAARGEDAPRVEDRIRTKLQLAIPSDEVRRAALEVLRWSIEAADADRSDAWYLCKAEHGLRLMAGRLFACDLGRSRLRVSVIGPVADDFLGTLAAEIVPEFKSIPGGQIVGMPLDKAEAALPLLKDGIDALSIVHVPSKECGKAWSTTLQRRSITYQQYLDATFRNLDFCIGR